MRSAISSKDAPSRVQRATLSRKSAIRGTSWVGAKSAPRSCPLLVPDYGEAPRLARAVYAASRRERSASPAEEYPGSRLAAVARTLRSSGDPGLVTRLIPRSPRPFSLLEAATSTERQPISISEQPRRSTATPVAPPVIAELSNSLQRLRAGASSSPSTSTSIRPPACLNLTEAPPHGLSGAEPPNRRSPFAWTLSGSPVGPSLSHSSRKGAALPEGREK
jgi:hypothetical protein